MRAMAKELNAQPEFVDTRFEQLITSLKSDHFDVVASALYITPDRAKQVDYIPYFTTGNSIVMPISSAPVTDAAGLCGMSVAVIKGGEVANQLRAAASSACTAGGKTAIDVRDFTADSEGTQALLSGQVDAQVTDAAVAKTAVDSNTGKLAITSKELLFPVPVGLLAQKDFWMAALTVIALAVLAWGISVVLGMVVALGRQSRQAWLRRILDVYVWFFRSLPLLVLLIFIYNAPRSSPSCASSSALPSRPV